MPSSSLLLDNAWCRDLPAPKCSVGARLEARLYIPGPAPAVGCRAFICSTPSLSVKMHNRTEHYTLEFHKTELLWAGERGTDPQRSVCIRSLAMAWEAKNHGTLGKMKFQTYLSNLNSGRPVPHTLTPFLPPSASR